VNYGGTWVEWVLTLGGIGALCLFFTLGSKLVPIVPLSVAGEAEEIKENKV